VEAKDHLPVPVSAVPVVVVLVSLAQSPRGGGAHQHRI